MFKCFYGTKCYRVKCILHFCHFFISKIATVAPGYRQQVTRILSVNGYIPKIPQKKYLFRFPSTPLNWFSIKQLSKNNTAPKKNQKNIITVKQIVATCYKTTQEIFIKLLASLKWVFKLNVCINIFFLKFYFQNLINNQKA